SVAAVDLAPRFLEADPRPNLAIHRRDILADGVPGDGYDLIHARALLMHLPAPDELVVELVGRLRPGGAILLEEPDFHLVSIADSALYAEVWSSVFTAGAKAGGDWNWGRHLPASLTAAGATGVTAVVESVMFTGGGPLAELTALTWEQVTPRLVADGIVAADRIAAATAELTDPGRWFPTVDVVAPALQVPGRLDGARLCAAGAHRHERALLAVRARHLPEAVAAPALQGRVGLDGARLGAAGAHGRVRTALAIGPGHLPEAVGSPALEPTVGLDRARLAAAGAHGRVRTA